VYMIIKKLPIFLFLLIVLSSCQNIATISLIPSPTTYSEEITVAAAADLQFAFSDIVKLYEEQTGHKVTLVFGSTGQLVQQIENGAPFDLIASANISYIEQLAENGLVMPESAELYARGRIVLAVNRQSGVEAVDLKDLLADNIQHIAIANPEHAPYGLAAKQALQSLGLWEELADKLVYGENVRQALQFVQTGDAEVGIISLSVASVPEITWTLIDEQLHTPLDQALAILTASKNPELAQSFIEFINGEIGRPIMRQYGFLLPNELNLRSDLFPQP